MFTRINEIKSIANVNKLNKSAVQWNEMLNISNTKKIACNLVFIDVRHVLDYRQ